MDDPVLFQHYSGHKSDVTSVSFNPNLKQVASGSLDSSVMIWNLKPNVTTVLS